MEKAGLGEYTEKDDCEKFFNPNFSFHTLRHVTASLLIDQGWEHKKVQIVMGHANIATTLDIYGHLFPTPKDDLESMRQIEAALLA